MKRHKISDVLFSTILSKENGWRRSDRPEYAACDISVENADREVWLVNIATDQENRSDSLSAICTAMGRLLLLMNRGFELNSFGLAERDDSKDPALVRYAIAVPDSPVCVHSAQRIPDRIRVLIQLSIVLVSKESCSLFLPSVPLLNRSTILECPPGRKE